MTYTNRNEFLEKFREKQAVSFNNYNSNSQSQTLDLSKSKISVGESDGRWEFLYQLDKIKKVKLEKLRRQKEENEYEKDFKECTFSPKLNEYHFTQGALSTFSNINNTSRANTSNIINKSRLESMGKIYYI
jgi:hypothetical protein